MLLLPSPPPPPPFRLPLSHHPEAEEGTPAAAARIARSHASLLASVPGMGDRKSVV